MLPLQSISVLPIGKSSFSSLSQRLKPNTHPPPATGSGNKDISQFEDGYEIGFLWALCRIVVRYGRSILSLQSSRVAIVGVAFQMVVDFTATWCGPCRIMAPFLAEIAKEFVNAIFVKVDVDELKTVAQEWSVEAMPTFMFLKDGKLIDKVVGANKGGLHMKVAEHAKTADA